MVDLQAPPNTTSGFAAGQCRSEPCHAVSGGGKVDLEREFDGQGEGELPEQLLARVLAQPQALAR